MNNRIDNRWWIYQRERFPLLAHGAMVAVFCLSLLSFSSLSADRWPDEFRVAAAFVSALIFFFQLRVADEFKDARIDSKYRPHRPVPRGLVSLGELAGLALLGAAVQFVIALAIDIGLIPLLFGVWLYIGLMTREFFVPDWLTRRPAIYLLSHMVVMPLIAGYVSAFEWLVTGQSPPNGIVSVLLFVFASGVVLEIGRKLRAAPEERPGVETYSAAWGPQKAVAVWFAFVVLSAVVSLLSIGVAEAPAWLTLLAVSPVAAAAFLAWQYATHCDESKAAGRLEPASGLITIALYLALGPLQGIAA